MYSRISSAGTSTRPGATIRGSRVLLPLPLALALHVVEVVLEVVLDTSELVLRRGERSPKATLLNTLMLRVCATVKVLMYEDI